MRYILAYFALMIGLSGVSLARVLAAAGGGVVVPRGQGCCGAITIHAGQMPLGRELAKRNIDAFERSGADVYVINAAGCGSALKEYGHLFHDDPEWSERAIAFSASFL